MTLRIFTSHLREHLAIGDILWRMQVITHEEMMRVVEAQGQHPGKLWGELLLDMVPRVQPHHILRALDVQARLESSKTADAMVEIYEEAIARTKEELHRAIADDDEPPKGGSNA